MHVNVKPKKTVERWVEIGGRQNAVRGGALAAAKANQMIVQRSHCVQHNCRRRLGEGARQLIKRGRNIATVRVRSREPLPMQKHTLPTGRESIVQRAPE